MDPDGSLDGSFGGTDQIDEMESQGTIWSHRDL